MKELPEYFEGKGEVAGFSFHQVIKTTKWCVYEVTHPRVKKSHFEVFLRRVNKRFNCESYPRSTAFGKWAWTCPDLRKAKLRMASISK